MYINLYHFPTKSYWFSDEPFPFTLSSNHWSAWQPLAISFWEYLSVLLMQYISSLWNSWNLVSTVDSSPTYKLTSLQFILAKLSLSFSFQHQIPETEGKYCRSANNNQSSWWQFNKSISKVGDQWCSGSFVKEI